MMGIAKKTSPQAVKATQTVEAAAETPAAETPAAETPAAETPAAETPADPWASLDAPETRTPIKTSKLDVEKETPAPIKERLQRSFDAVYAALHVMPEATPSQKSTAVKKLWKVQKFPTKEMAEQFVKLAERYCRLREEKWTLRKQVSEDGLSVAYLVKPFEAKERPAAAPKTPAAPETPAAETPAAETGK